MNVIPMFVAVPFTARLMAYFRYPYVDDYASFIPGILFVIVLLAFVGNDATRRRSCSILWTDLQDHEYQPFLQKELCFEISERRCHDRVLSRLREVVFLSFISRSSKKFQPGSSI